MASWRWLFRLHLKEVAVFLLFGSVLLAFWPLVLLLMVVAFWRVNKKNVVRVGAKLSSLSFSECSEFEPCIWLCFPFLSGHLQTVSVLFKKTKLQTWYDERCAVKLGGSLIGLWWRHGGARDPRTPVVVIFPGLTGDATSSYAVQMVEHLSPDFRCVLACPRGCGDSSLGTRPYNARDAADHVLVLEHVRSRFPNCKIFAVGFSLGANLLVNALSDFSDRLLFLQGAAALGSPWNLQRSSKLLESGLSRLLFSASLAEGLVKFYLRNEQAMNAFAFPRPVELKSLTSVRKFDAAITGPAAGYRSVDDYYEDASTHERVNNVKVPLLCISAMDDPVVSGNSMPMRECRNEMVALVLTGAGGHLGWAENSWRPLSACWADRAVAQFFRQLK